MTGGVLGSEDSLEVASDKNRWEGPTWDEISTVAKQMNRTMTGNKSLNQK
jgi:hypothetical protein